MPFITSKCPHCGKLAETEREFTINDKTILSLKCGHLLEKQHLNHSSPEQIVSIDGKSLYNFQCEGVRFGEEASGRFLLADEMGLGKTPQAISLLLLHPEMRPFLCIVKSSLKTQWQREIGRWMGEDFFAPIIETPRDLVMKGFVGYILSYDILRRFDSRKKKTDLLGARALVSKEIREDYDYLSSTITEKEKTEESKLLTLIKKLGIKTVILDECQQIKNPDSQRTVFTRIICKEVPYVIGLSGTPIKNNAAEYFPILNILKPEIFPRFSTFLQQECDSYFNGFSYKTGGLRNPNCFKEKTKSFILRRERKEVLPDLPPIRRSFQFHELSKEVEKIYLETFVKFRDEYNSIGTNHITDESFSFEQQGSIMALMSKLRHCVGLSLINPCIDYVMEVMGSTEDRLTIFTHHDDVAEILENKLNSIFDEIGIPHCARHEAGSPALETEASFEKTRVLICSTLAGGEGLNLQKLCSRFVMLERQWNPANEEQAESRFPRPEGIQADFIDGVYMTAIGTINEMFAEIVEKKREIVGKTLSGEAAQWDQSSIMKELAEVLATTGGRKWSI